MRSWVIGSRADCDVVVDSPIVSGRHCQLTQTPDGIVLDDLGATNGTFVDGVRITAPTRVVPGEAVTLGKTLPMPWPPDLARFIAIGRLPDNEIVLDDQRVSGHHARLIVIEGRETRIQDLGSSNGTFLNSADRRVTIPTCVSASDMLYFGTLAVPASQLLAQVKRPDTPAQPQERQTAVAVVEPIPAPAAVGSPRAGWPKHRCLLIWLGQIPVLSLVIVMLWGRSAAVTVTDSNWPMVGQGIAATSFALALAAIWLGCSLAVAELASGRSSVKQNGIEPAIFATTFTLRLAILSAFCAGGCALLLAIVYWGGGLKGPWQAMWAVVVMTSLIGLFFGLAVSAFVAHSGGFPPWCIVAAVSLIAFLPMAALGGWFWPLPTIASTPVRKAADIMPSRWAFEGLVLLETAEHSPPLSGEGSIHAENHDPVEPFFPAATERMGARADMMALVSMAIALASVTAFVSWTSRPDP
jgi:hypothetical protein